MSNAQLATTTAPRASALAVMASRFNVDPKKLLETLKGTVFAAARSEEEIIALVIVSNEYKLNPLTKEIYAFPAKGGGIVPVISIDGWANLANSHPQMNGMDFEWEHKPDGGLISCTCIIHRKDRQHPTKVTEYLSECRRNTDPWKMEHRMLRHKALSQCVRIAFGFSGIYDEDDGRAISEARDITPQGSTSVLFKAPPALEQKAEPPQSTEKYNLAFLMQRDNITWPDICQTLMDNGVIADAYRDESECTPEEAQDIIRDWTKIIELVKGGQGE